MFKAGFLQFNPVFGKVEENKNFIISNLDGIDTDIVVLPELPFTGYNFTEREELGKLAEDPNSSQLVEELKDLCRRNSFHLVTGFAEKSGNKIYNSSLLISPNENIRIYRKLHLFNNEKNYFDKGDLPLQVYSIGEIKIGMMICFDWIFPEVARSLAVLGADLICHPSNLVLTYCQKTMIGRAIENGVYIITANRIGTEERPHAAITFTGQSQIVSPNGEILRKAEDDEIDLCVYELHEEQARDKKITPLNNIITDRRPEFYKLLVT